MCWCFAQINNKLAEIYFQKNKNGIKLLGHCYVKKSEFKTKKEQNWIEKDTSKFKFVYSNKEYKRLLT